MSFVPTKADFAQSRLRLALPIISGLAGAILLFLAMFLTGAHRYLAKMEQQATAARLVDYLRQSSATAPLQLGTRRQEGERLGGLDFLRVSRGSNRLLLTGEAIGADRYQDLLHQGLEDGAWRKLPGSTDERVFSIVSRTMDNGVTVQGGRDSTSSYQQYRTLERYVLGSGVAGTLLAVIVGLACARVMTRPLDGLCEELEQLIAGGRQQLLTGETEDSEQGRLCRQINRLIRQNRKLVDGMQMSLDSVAHDLRTPMTRLRSVAEFGLREGSNLEKLRQSLAECLEESERVLAMLRIMMSVAEAETGTIHLDLERLELSESIGQMVELYAYVAEERQVTLSTQVPAGLVLMADRTRIAQVWANLLDNAIKYGREGGWVRIEASQLDDRIIIDFRDNGMGISAAEQPRIWERLYRGDRSRSRQGLGLGLNYVKAMVEAHGGTVEVESALHQGSCFTVQLPVAQMVPLSLPTVKSQISGEWSDNRTSGM